MLVMIIIMSKKEERLGVYCKIICGLTSVRSRKWRLTIPQSSSLQSASFNPWAPRSGLETAMIFLSSSLCECLCPNNFLSKDTSQMELERTHMTSFYLKYLSKVLSPNIVTFWGSGY